MSQDDAKAGYVAKVQEMGFMPQNVLDTLKAKKVKSQPPPAAIDPVVITEEVKAEETEELVEDVIETEESKEPTELITD